ncbi:hypothetical protein QBC34DRAFT_303476 [Podospora aff. communis PSN243]|uniref:Uncharacterized protein n=1 Tax=Podospora aff. communis PSN243 TaxID=3040156 RepID=A0AAV9GG40_9PEZI|nr:hypothetical protein QBC34DRAFT_303476 [Podospora aff. communis PSN243]
MKVLVRLKGQPESNWHKLVKLQESPTSFSEQKIPQATDAAAQLRRCTDACVARWARSSKVKGQLPPEQLDANLAALIVDHETKESGRREAAVLACLPTLSAHAATKHLASLQETLDGAQYLQCILRAGLTRPDIISATHIQIADALKQLLDWSLTQTKPDFVLFRALVLTLQNSTSQESALLDSNLIDLILRHTKFKVRGEAELQSLQTERRLRTLFDITSWLRLIDVDNSANAKAAATILENHLPSWQRFQSWSPDKTRIQRWEEAFDTQTLTPIRQQKLGHIFDLEGPDTTGKQCTTLKLSEPACFRHVRVAHATSELLSRLLNLLDLAIAAGPHAVDLFVTFCVGEFAVDNATVLIVQQATLGGDDLCAALLFTQKGLDTSLEAIDRAEGLSRALPDVLRRIPLPEALSSFYSKKLSVAVPDVIRRCQAVFCKQMDEDSEAMEITGMSLHGLGTALAMNAAATSSFLLGLPTDIEAFVEHLRPVDIVQAVFRQLHAFRNPYDLHRRDATSDRGSSLRDYLTRSLGGRGGVSADHAGVTAELEFWKCRPTADLVELARAIGGIKSVDSRLYASCLLQMAKEERLAVQDLTARVRAGGPESCATMTRYLVRQLEIGNHPGSCWVSLLTCMINEQGPDLLDRLADSIATREWLQFTQDIRRLLEVGNSSYDAIFGQGPNRQGMEWWDTLSSRYSNAVEFLNDTILRRSGGALKWLYRSPPSPAVMSILQACREPALVARVEKHVLSHLLPGAENISKIAESISSLRRADATGYILVERLTIRSQSRSWTPSGLGALGNALAGNPGGLPHHNRQTMAAFMAAVNLSQQVLTNDALEQAASQLKIECNSILDSAGSLGSSITQLKRSDPQRATNVLQQTGIVLSGGGNISLPEELIDSVDLVEEGKYAMVFALSALSELQRKARGIPPGSRCLLVGALLLPAARPKFTLGAGNPDSSGVAQKLTSLFAFTVHQRLETLVRSSSGPITIRSVHQWVAGQAPSACFPPRNPSSCKFRPCQVSCSLLSSAPVTSGRRPFGQQPAVWGEAGLQGRRSSTARFHPDSSAFWPTVWP